MGQFMHMDAPFDQTIHSFWGCIICTSVPYTKIEYILHIQGGGRSNTSRLIFVDNDLESNYTLTRLHSGRHSDIAGATGRESERVHVRLLLCGVDGHQLLVRVLLTTAG